MLAKLEVYMSLAFQRLHHFSFIILQDQTI